MKQTIWKPVSIMLIITFVVTACQTGQEITNVTPLPVPSPQSTPSTVSEVAFFQIQETAGTLVMNPNGKTMAFDPQSDEVPTVYLMDVASGQIIYPLEDALEMLAFSPDGKTIATANGKRVLVWNVSTGKVIHTLKHKQDIRTASFSPDSQIIVTSGEEGAYVWNAVKGRKIHIIEGNLEAFSPNSQMVVTYGDGWVRVWDITTKQFIDSIAGDWAGLSPDRRTFVIYDESDTGTQSFQVYNSTTGKKTGTFEGSRPIFSPDGQIIATYYEDKTYLWSVTTGQEVGVFEGDCSAFSPDGQTLATCQNGNAYLWNIASGLKIKSFIILDDSGYGGVVDDLECWITFSPDGRILATSAGDYYRDGDLYGRPIALFDIADGSRVRFWGIFKAFGPTGQIFVSVEGYYDDYNLHVWHSDGQRIDSMPLYYDISQSCSHCTLDFAVQFSPDGQQGFVTTSISVYNTTEFADPASPGGQNIHAAKPLTIISLPGTLMATPTITPTRTPTVTPTRRR